MATTKQREHQEQQAEHEALAAAEQNVAEQASESAPRPDQASPPPEVELPIATGDLGAYPLTYHKPVLVLPDGTEVKYEARWGFEDAKKARAWLRKTAAEHGVRVEVPE